jgi:hypothetical protein
MSGDKLAIGAVAALAALSTLRGRGSRKVSPSRTAADIDRILLQAERDFIQLHRCVLSVYKERTDESLPPHERLSDAFAICVKSFQDYGYLKPGSRTPTAKGKAASRKKMRDPDAIAKQKEYQKLKILARRSRLEQKLGSANKLSKKWLKSELQKIRDSMEPVFSCDTVFGTCREEAPSAGHCFMAAMAVQDILGGQIKFGEVVLDGEPVAHYWNKIGGWEVDITGDQFRQPEVQLKKGKLRPSLGTFDRKRYEYLEQDFNKEPMKIYDRFRKKLIHEFEDNDLCEYVGHIKLMEKA